MRNRMGPMAEDLNRDEAGFERARLQFSTLLAYELPERDMAAVYVIDGEGRVLARAEQPSAPPFLAPPPADFAAAARRDQVALPFSSDYIRALMRLRAYPDAYLYVARPMGEGIMAQLRRSQESVAALPPGRPLQRPHPGHFHAELCGNGPAGARGGHLGRRDGGDGDRGARLAPGAGGRPGGGRRPQRPGGHLTRPGGDRGAEPCVQPHDRRPCKTSRPPSPPPTARPATARASSKPCCRG